MSKKFFNAPYGYMDSIGLVSKKSQVEDMLNEVKESFTDNVELDAAQDEKILANASAIKEEVTRSTEQDTDFKESLDFEVSERKRMGVLLNDKISSVEKLISASSSSSSSLIVDLQNKDIELQSHIDTVNKQVDTVSKDIEKEKEERSKQDVSLKSFIDKTKLVLENADASLAANMSTIENNLRNEISTLSSQNGAISQRIDGVENDFLKFKTSGVTLTKKSSLEYELFLNGESIGVINIPQDNFLKSVSLVNDSILQFIFITDGKESTVNVGMSNLIDIYTAGNGLTVNKKEFSIKVNGMVNKVDNFLKVDSDGIYTDGIKNAIDVAVLEEKGFREASVKDIESKIGVIETTVSTMNTNLNNTISEKVASEENRAKSVEQGINNKIDILEGYVPTIKNNSSNIIKLNSEISNETMRASNVEADLSGRLDKVEENKVDVIDLGNNRKAITLKNNDLLLGTDTKGSTYNIAMLSKWDVVDLGTSSLPINLNTPKDVRPTVQEQGQSGEEAHKIAYLSDVEAVKGSIPSLEGYATEESVEAVKAIIPSLDGYATEESVNEVKASIPSLEGYATEEWVKEKGYLTEHQDISKLATKEEVDEITKNVVKYNEAVDKKVVLLDNGDLIMGKVNLDSAIQPIPSATTLTLLQLNKWNIVDVGSPKSIVNLNVREGYRPTVQESNQSGDEAHEIAYLDDIDSLKEMIMDLQNRIKLLESKVYNGSQLVGLLRSLEEGKTSDIILCNSITIDTTDKLVVPKNATLNLDLNGHTLNFTSNDILLRVQEGGTFNISGGTFVGKGYVASANSGGTVNVLNGTYNVQVTCFQSYGGTVNVYNGHFEATSDKFGPKFTLNHIDSTKYDGKITVYGGTFVDYDPSNSPSENPVMNFVADGYGVVAEVNESGKTIYTVVKTNDVSTSGDFITSLNSLAKDEKMCIKLTDNIEIAADIEHMIINGDVNIDLNGKTITYMPVESDILFRVNGNLTIGNGSVNVNGYVASGNKGSIITVLNGTYNCDVTCFQSNGGVVNVNDGYFSACNEIYSCKYTLNFIDSMKEVGKIIVTGGKYVGYDPSNSMGENPAMNFVAEGYKVEEKVENELTIYEVIKE